MRVCPSIHSGAAHVVLLDRMGLTAARARLGDALVWLHVDPSDPRVGTAVMYYDYDEEDAALARELLGIRTPPSATGAQPAQRAQVPVEPVAALGRFARLALLQWLMDRLVSPSAAARMDLTIDLGQAHLRAGRISAAAELLDQAADHVDELVEQSSALRAGDRWRFPGLRAALADACGDYEYVFGPRHRLAHRNRENIQRLAEVAHQEIPGAFECERVVIDPEPPAAGDSSAWPRLEGRDLQAHLCLHGWPLDEPAPPARGRWALPGAAESGHPFLHEMLRHARAETLPPPADRAEPHSGLR